MRTSSRYREVMDLAGAPLDPTGYGLVGQLLALAGMLAGLVVVLRWWFQNRGR